MAKVAVLGSLSSNTNPFGRDASDLQARPAMKKKTPSELRGEQLKRKAGIELAEEPSALFGSEKSNNGIFLSTKKLVPTKNPRYIDTRVDEVFPVKKSSNMFRMLSEKAKDNFSSEQINGLKIPPATACNMAVESRPTCPDSSTTSSPSPSASATVKGSSVQPRVMTEKCSTKTLRTVAELSLGKEKSSGQPTIDMTTMLKRLSARETSATSHSHAETFERGGDIQSGSSGNFSSELQFLGHKTPIDLTLRTTMRLISSSSVNWCHRLTTSSTTYGMPQFGSANANPCHAIGSTKEELFSKALCSWVFPQSSLPPSVISALTLTSGKGEIDFLLKRQLAWEDSFRSLYYMLRKCICDIFYVCTSQFVVMFSCGYDLGKTKRFCNAYVSRSTRGLRSLLREQDICFSMPLCHSEVEQATAEDLVELTEIGKHNLGQTHRRASMSDVDNSPQSLLVFSGNENVHGLYDFLLNYRSFLISLNSVDVPVIYSPKPFLNASLSAPEVKCKEMKTVDAVALPPKWSHAEDVSSEDSSAGVCYSIEIKGPVLPPWTICGLCAAMGSEGRSFEASFIDEPLSVGLNVALDTMSGKSDLQTETAKSTPERDNVFGVSDVIVSPCLRAASLKILKYSSGSYTASLAPV